MPRRVKRTYTQSPSLLGRLKSEYGKVRAGIGRMKTGVGSWWGGLKPRTRALYRVGGGAAIGLPVLYGGYRWLAGRRRREPVTVAASEPYYYYPYMFQAPVGAVEGVASVPHPKLIKRAKEIWKKMPTWQKVAAVTGAVGGLGGVSYLGAKKIRKRMGRKTIAASEPYYYYHPYMFQAPIEEEQNIPMTPSQRRSYLKKLAQAGALGLALGSGLSAGGYFGGKVARKASKLAGRGIEKLKGVFAKK